MLTAARLEEVAAWMRRNGVTQIIAAREKEVHLWTEELKRLAPDAIGTPAVRDATLWEATVDGLYCIALDLPALSSTPAPF
jgi:hypothetical protein